jgi:hypothetical protein
MVAVQRETPDTQGVCRFCGRSNTGIPFDSWVKDTFTDHDKLLPGEIVCNSCLFWFDERSEDLASRVGKDKPQRMRNYSHFIHRGEWVPLSKGDKGRMRELLLSDPFPELAVVAESGQKHLVFRAVRNPPDNRAGWVQFEEQRLWVEPAELGSLLETIEELYVIFSKSEIESGDYSMGRIAKFGMERWTRLDIRIRGERGKPLFALAIFLAQRKEDSEDGRETSEGGGAAGADLEGDACRLQEPLPADYKSRYRRTIWQQFEDQVRSAAYTNNLGKFLSSLCLKLDAEIGTNAGDRERANELLAGIDGRDLLRLLREESTLVVLMVRVANQERQEAAKARQLAILKQGWPELYNRFVAAHPEAGTYT